MRSRLLAPRVLGPVLVVATFAIGGLWFYVPHLTEAHPNVISTPSLVGFQSSKQVVVRRGQQACIAPVPLEPALRTVRMVLQARGTQSSPLELELRAPGYRGTGRFTGYSAGGPVDVDAAVSPAPPRDADGTSACATPAAGRRAGRHRRAAVAHRCLPRRSTASPLASVDPAITFLGGPPQSMISRAGTILGRASDFTGGYVPLWLLWPLAVLLVLGRAAGARVGAARVARPRGGTARVTTPAVDAAGWRVTLMKALARSPPWVRQGIFRSRRAVARTRRRRLEAKGDFSTSYPALHEMDRQLERYLPEPAGFFVEAGGNDGYTQSNTYALRTPARLARGARRAGARARAGLRARAAGDRAWSARRWWPRASPTPR